MFILALNTVFIAVFISFAHCVHLFYCVLFLKRSQQKKGMTEGTSKSILVSVDTISTGGSNCEWHENPDRERT